MVENNSNHLFCSQIFNLIGSLVKTSLCSRYLQLRTRVSASTLTYKATNWYLLAVVQMLRQGYELGVSVLLDMRLHVAWAPSSLGSTGELPKQSQVESCVAFHNLVFKVTVILPLYLFETIKNI